MKLWTFRIRWLHLHFFAIFKKPRRHPPGDDIAKQVLYAYSHWVTGPRRNLDGLGNIRRTMPDIYDLQGKKIDDMEAKALALSLIAEKDFANLLVDLYTNYDIIPKKKPE